jgi:outer membrane immunogenic protein
MTPSIQIGFDWQAGATVYGVELDHTFASIKKETIYDTPVGDPVSVYRTDELKSMTLLKGRMGLAFGNGLFFATAGVGKTKVDHTWIEVGDPNDSWPTFSNDHTAFVYGFGMEHRITPLLGVKAEFLKVSTPTTSSVNVDRYPMEVNEDVTTFRVGVNFHF